MPNSEIEALISLLDDPDTLVFDQVKEKLISMGSDIIPHLENAWELSLDNLLQNRIEDIIHYLQFDSIQKSLTQWLHSEDHDLIEGAIIIAKYQYPDLDEKKIYDYFNQISQDVWLELHDGLTALEQVKVLNRIIFDIHSFSGNKKNINSPQNSYINNVFETKKGNPITLGLIYIAICQKLNLPIHGVSVPEHFVLTYSENMNNLFYINPFNSGFVFSRYDIEKYIEQLKKEHKDEYYNPCDNLTILRRLLEHLVFTYDNLGYVDKKEELSTLLKILGDQSN